MELYRAFDNEKRALRYLEEHLTLMENDTVVFDIDGTIITNGQAEPTIKLLYNHAVAQQCNIHFVTAREKRHRRSTEKELQRNGFHVYEALWMLPSTCYSSWQYTMTSTNDVAIFKAEAREAIEELHDDTTITLTVGNLSLDHCLRNHFQDEDPDLFVVGKCRCDDHYMFKLPDEQQPHDVRSRQCADRLIKQRMAEITQKCDIA